MGEFSILMADAIARLDAHTATIGVGGLLRIYDPTGGVPARADVALTTQVLLTEHALANPAFQGAVDGGNNFAEAVANAIAADQALATATAAFYRVVTSGGVAKGQGDVGLVGSGAALELTVVALTTGIEVQIPAGGFVWREADKRTF